jgi:beta-lactamase regulating signal transducer with metallopeptidase domain
MLHWFAETTLVAAALAALAAVGCRAGRLGPGARHALWLIVLLKLVTPPLFRIPLPAVVPTPGGPAEGTLAACAVEVVAEPEPEAPALVFVGPVPEPPPAPGIPALLPAGPGEAAGPPTPEPWGVMVTAEAPVETLAAVGRVARPDPAVEVGVASAAASPPSWGPDVERSRRWAFAAWAVGALGLLATDLARVAGFARRARRGEPAPEWIEEELEALAERLGVRAPRAVLVPGVGTPMLWCLGRPRLILPPELVKEMPRDAWRGVLAHELAHVRRGDPWVGRATLLARWLWWWNPVFWLVKARLEAEAELACDAWVLWALPGHQKRYARALVDVCARIAETVAPVPSPSWGVGGAGRFFERRLTMILKSKPLPAPPKAASLAAGLLALVALPSWSTAQDDPKPRDDERPRAETSDDGDRVEETRRVEVRIEKQDEGDGKARVILTRPVRVRLDARARDAGDDNDDGAKQDDPEAKGRREEIEARVLEATARMKEAQDRMQKRMQEAQKRMQEEMRGAQEEMQQAQRELAELHKKLAEAGGLPFGFSLRQADGNGQFVVRGRLAGKPDEEGGVILFTPSAPAAPPAPAAARAASAPVARVMAPVPPVPPVASPDLERRVGDLEKKFDQILEELRALRRDRDDR